MTEADLSGLKDEKKPFATVAANSGQIPLKYCKASWDMRISKPQ